MTSSPPPVGQGTNFSYLGEVGLSGVAVSPFGEVSVSPTPQNLMHDTFDVSLDTTNLWVTPTAAGTGSQIATVAPGQVTLIAGTAANGYSYLLSKQTFSLIEPGYIETCLAIKVPTAIPTNTYAAWGFFTPQAVPTAANPISEGLVFEIQPGGKMYVASYAGGSRTMIADLSAASGSGKQPIDGITHAYYVFSRGDLLAWAIDGISIGNFVNVQNNGINGPNVNSQTIACMVVNGTSAPSSAMTLTCAAAWVAATGTSGWLSDGTFAFRKATVKAAGVNPATTDTALVVIEAPVLTIGGNASGTTGAVVGTLAAAAGKMTRLAGFNVQAIGGTATCGPVIVAGLAGGSQTYQTDVNSATQGKQICSQLFNPPLEASALNTAITITTTANGTATAVNVNSWGDQC